MRSCTKATALTLDADTGRVYAGRLPVVHERPQAALDQVAAWRAAAASADRRT